MDAVRAAGLAAGGDLAWWLIDNGFYDVRATDWPVLQLVERGPLGMCALAVPLGITQQATSKAVTCLERRGYVDRIRPQSDRRRHETVLTSAGRGLLVLGVRRSAPLQGRHASGSGPSSA